MSESSASAAFHDACKGQNCPFCEMRARSDARYLAFFLAEYVNDSDVNDHLLHSFGFCHAHAWQVYQQDWSGIRDGLGVAIAYERIVNHWQQILRHIQQEDSVGLAGLALLKRQLLQPHESVGGLAAQALHQEERCPACVRAEQTEQSALAEIAGLMANEETDAVWEWLESSRGLCLPHLRLLLPFLGDKRSVRHLCRLQDQHLESMRTNLSEFVRKHDWRFQGEAYTNGERTCCRDVVALHVGKRVYSSD